MKLRYRGKTEYLVLTNGRVYEVIAIEKERLRIVDDSGDDYLYPSMLFELIEN